MEKLTSILLVLESADTDSKVLEKTIALARRFGARVDLLLDDPHVAAQLAASCSARGYDEVLPHCVARGRESLAELIPKYAIAHSPDLVVKPRAGAHAEASGIFQRVDQQLAMACPAPLMLMQEKDWPEPVRIAATVDVSGEEAALARGILDIAGFLSLGCGGELAVLYSEREHFDESLRMERAVKLARLVREFHVDGQRIRHLNGAPEETLPPIAASGEYDVLVVGALTHQQGLAAWRATLTRRVVAAFAGDVVLVKEAAPACVGQRMASLKYRVAL